ncbi:MAG: phosphodiester glycosidase family protein [Comamonadaceae bacterium]|jgi:exopolysaccharide biosynthesis protein|nr:phosphodiester glycosidase family protein [Comamonadaceae bacterium]
MLRLFLTGVLLALVSACAGVAPVPPDGWQPLAPGLAHRAWAPWPDSDVQALRVDLRQLRLALSPPAESGLPVDQMASGRGALASVNASFFNREFRPRGVTVSDGQLWPVLLKAPAGAKDPLLACDTQCVIRFDAPPTPEPAWRLAVSGTPWLVRDGQARTAEDDASCASLCANTHPRTAVGLDASGRHLLVLLAAGRRGEVKGLTLAQTAQLMRELGAVQAFNLDGGGSSTLLIGGESRLPRPLNEPALRRVANALHVLTP